MSKKLLAMLLAVIMVLSALPALALASSADDPVEIHGIIAAAGYKFETDAENKLGIAYDFYFGDGDTLHDDMKDIVEADPEIVPGTMAANLGAYTFTVTLTDADNNAETHEVTTSVKNDWGTYDQGIWFDLSAFTVDGTYTVRIDITTPSGKAYFAEEGGLSYSAPKDEGGTIEGTEVTWTFAAATGTLTLDGTGAVPDYTDTSARPWNALSDGIKTMIVKGGITALGRAVGNSLKKLDKLVLEEGVTSCGFDCFAHCGTIAEVYLPTTLTSLAQGVFYSTSITDLYCDLTSREFGESCTMGAYNDAVVNANWVNDPDWGSSGDLSDTVAWSFDADEGTLSITGTGAIPSVATKPWQQYVSQITWVDIGEGITEIPGGGLFAHLDNLEFVTMAETVTKIGGDAFAYNGLIDYFQLSSNVVSISQGVVYASQIDTVSCKKDWRAIQQQASIGSYNDAFANAEWEDVEIYGTYFSFGKYGEGMEIWSGDTQVLICPKWDGVWNADFKAACTSQPWTLVFEADGYETVTSHIYNSTIYDGGSWAIMRFMPATASDPAERFVPVPGVEYTVTATITYNGKTETVTSGDKFKLPEGQTPVTYDTFYQITWTVEGVEEYTENVAEGKKPVYHGAAASYEDENFVYVANVPATVAAAADATYDITFTKTDKASGTLALWGSGYENWAGGTGGTQTELLLRPKDWQGNDLSKYDGTAAMQAVDWFLTINGVEYKAKPATHYAAMIFRFEPDLWENPLILKPGQYVVDLTIKNADGEVEFYTTAPTTITVAEDFVPVENLELVKEGTEVYVVNRLGEQKSGWFEFDGKQVYFKKDGKMIRFEEATIGGKSYVFTPFEYEGLTLYAGAEKPAPVKNGLVKDSDGVRFYEDGVAFEGWKEFDGKQVYFKKGGLMIRYEEAVIGGVSYVFEAFTYENFTLYAGSVKPAPVKNGLVKESDGIRYYVDGVAQTGWIVIDGAKLYFKKSNGLMNRYTDIVIGGVAYTFESFTSNGLKLYKVVEA